MNLHLNLPLSKEQYQDGRERFVETGKRCPECGRCFDNNAWLTSHLEAVHGVLTARRAAELERRKEKDLAYQRRLYRRRTRQA